MMARWTFIVGAIEKRLQRPCMTSVFPSCLASSALRFRRAAGHWSSRTSSAECDADYFEPSPVALRLAEDVLPRTEDLRQIATRYLKIYADFSGFTRGGEWAVESVEFDLPPLLAADQFSLCLRHPGDAQALWRVIFRRLPAHEAILLGEEATPVALHREQRRWQ
jgi:hypothetical protein